jgi:hypothetical protein
MNDLMEYTGDGDAEQSEFHNLDLDEIASAACEALKAASDARNKWLEGRNEWIAETLRLARLLVEGRQRFPSNWDFGTWIDGIEGLSPLSHQDRAALIKFGKWPAITRDVLEKTRRNSWREIWDKEAKRVIEPSSSKKRRVTSPGKTDDDEVDEVEVAESGGPPLLNLVDDEAEDIAATIIDVAGEGKAMTVAVSTLVLLGENMALAAADTLIERYRPHAEPPLTTSHAAEPVKRRRGRPRKVATK